jgi:hypothetical protein
MKTHKSTKFTGRIDKKKKESNLMTTENYKPQRLTIREKNKDYLKQPENN